jgi:DMSO/TMAO reductase YedYZ molybdopterin-dependent catalytic subunit
VATETWKFGVVDEKGNETSWSWDEFQALGAEDIHTDIHCVTRWSKLGTSWRGVSLDKVFAKVDTSYEYVMAHSYGGYTTNVPLTDLLDGKAWVATEFEGEPLDPEHGGPARLLVPHLYFWKSAKWVRGLTMMPTDEPGFWEERGYNIYGDPWKEERYS